MIPTALPLTDEAGQVGGPAGIAPFVRVGTDCIHYTISEPALFEAQDGQEDRLSFLTVKLTVKRVYFQCQRFTMADTIRGSHGLESTFILC
jgi:hypothetical protein